MGISETYFFSDIEAVERRHMRQMPAKPRSVLVREAHDELKRIVAHRERMLHRLSEACEMLDGIPDEFREHLEASNSQWKGITGDSHGISSVLRHKMADVHRSGRESILRRIESWLAERTPAAEEAIRQAELLPESEADEKAYAEWNAKLSDEINAMDAEYDRLGYWR